MSIRKDPRSPYWQFDFQVKGRRFHGSTHCTTKRDAERYEANLRRSVALGDVDKRPTTLDEAGQAFWEHSGQHDKAAKTTDYQVANLINIIGAGKLLSEIGTKEFHAFISRRRSDGVGPSSINRELEIARRIWKLARESGCMVPGQDDAGAIKWAKLMLAEPKERVRELTPDEQKRLFANLTADLAAVVEFAVLSGQRKSSVVTLERRKVDFDGMRAVVTIKGGKEHQFPLTARMVEIIRAQPEVAGCPFVFTYECRRPSPARADRPRRYKGKRYPFSAQGWTRQWKKALTDAGITDFRFHDLRHTNATRLLRSSGNLKVVQTLLGHSDIATTGRYAHVLEDDLRNAMVAEESRINHGSKLTARTKKRRISSGNEQ